MKTYIEEKIVNINAAKAWEALKCMEQWLPQLKSITKLEYDASDTFFFEGRQYNVYTPEGVTMKSVIEKVDETDYKIQINAQCFVLKSHLTCQVIPMDDSSCKLVRIQSYPGIIGTVFTSLFHRREGAARQEYKY